MANDDGRPAERESKDAKQAEKRLRKHLSRLRDELAAASKTESKRLRKLEKARWRRQRIQAFINEVQSMSAVDGAPTRTDLATPAAATGRPATKIARPKVAEGPAAGPKIAAGPKTAAAPGKTPAARAAASGPKAAPKAAAMAAAKPDPEPTPRVRRSGR
jgi:hypothetical protein